ncbi:MAG: signal recognition particle receptor subunit alpha, partial [Lachnospiraceae bacterium]|nr:signal recognition particle receptor subunit alpha [Lachnospiraceae bacterium]
MAGFFAKLFKGEEAIDDDFYEEVEETLFMGDMGVVATDELVENLKLNVLFRDVKTKSEAKTFMINKIAEIMQLPE